MKKYIFILAFTVIIPCFTVGQTAVPKDVLERYMSVSYPLRSIVVTSPFGQRRDPFTGRASWHSGLDLRARGDMVMAMLAGTVAKTGEDARSGRFVTISHGAVTVSYCHLSVIMAREGDKVMAGEKVGVTGSTGRSTGEHLHITCRYRGERVDPMLVIGFVRRVREECAAVLAQIRDS